jgi:hypothetical protein
VTSGDGHWEVDGEEVRVREGSYMRFDPGERSLPGGLWVRPAFISIGCRPGSYEPHGLF